jgi:hypothetical protein
VLQSGAGALAEPSRIIAPLIMGDGVGFHICCPHRSAGAEDSGLGTTLPSFRAEVMRGPPATLWPPANRRCQSPR